MENEKHKRSLTVTDSHWQSLTWICRTQLCVYVCGLMALKSLCSAITLSVPLVQDNPAHSRSSEEDLFRNVCDVDPDAGLLSTHIRTELWSLHISISPWKEEPQTKILVWYIMFTFPCSFFRALWNSSFSRMPSICLEWSQIFFAEMWK